jgi:hypothetical protein
VRRATPPQASLGRVPVGLLLLAAQADDGWRRELAVFVNSNSVPLGQSQNHPPLGKRLERVAKLRSNVLKPDLRPGVPQLGKSLLRLCVHYGT